MSQQNSQKLIEDFYAAFNAKKIDKMVSFVSDDVVFDMNDEELQKGKEAFLNMIKDSVKNYQENVENVVYMVSKDGKHVATKFTFKGKYITTDKSNIPAKGQPYEATAFNYFDIENDKIISARCWYNQKDWLKQVSKAA